MFCLIITSIACMTPFLLLIMPVHMSLIVTFCGFCQSTYRALKSILFSTLFSTSGCFLLSLLPGVLQLRPPGGFYRPNIWMLDPSVSSCIALKSTFWESCQTTVYLVCRYYFCLLLILLHVFCHLAFGVSSASTDYTGHSSRLLPETIS